MYTRLLAHVFGTYEFDIFDGITISFYVGHLMSLSNTFLDIHCHFYTFLYRHFLPKTFRRTSSAVRITLCSPTPTRTAKLADACNRLDVSGASSIAAM